MSLETRFDSKSSVLRGVLSSVQISGEVGIGVTRLAFARLTNKMSLERGTTVLKHFGE